MKKVKSTNFCNIDWYGAEIRLERSLVVSSKEKSTIRDPESWTQVFWKHITKNHFHSRSTSRTVKNHISNISLLQLSVRFRMISILMFSKKKEKKKQPTTSSCNPFCSTFKVQLCARRWTTDCMRSSCRELSKITRSTHAASLLVHRN
jgi:hypothetical protein